MRFYNIGLTNKVRFLLQCRFIPIYSFFLGAIAQLECAFVLHNLSMTFSAWVTSVLLLVVKIKVNNVHYRHILLYYFKKGKRATHKNVYRVYGDDALTERIC